MTKRYVLYHGNCFDGFGAAWAAWKALGDDAIYIPVLYGQGPPETDEGGIMTIVDFSYPRETLLALNDWCSSLDVLDHHKSAEAELKGLDFCLFDMEKSGAMLAWEWWHPHEEPPNLIRYLQDRDLWQFKLPASRVVSAWIQSYSFDFDVWDGLARNLDVVFSTVVAEGTAILRFKDQQVEQMCKHAAFHTVGSHLVPVANATCFFSEVGERLCQLYPESPFAAYYLDREDGMRQWGLRSRGDFDVSEVAKQYGGGGHAAASGFTEVQP